MFSLRCVVNSVVCFNSLFKAVVFVWIALMGFQVARLSGLCFCLFCCVACGFDGC